MAKYQKQCKSIADYIKSLIGTPQTAESISITITTPKQGESDQTITLTLYKDENNKVNQVNVAVPGNCDFNINSTTDTIDTSENGYPILANQFYNIDPPSQAGSGKRSKKHVKTARQHTCKDGVSRVVYTKNGKDYVKRKTRNGTYKYVKI